MTHPSPAAHGLVLPGPFRAGVFDMDGILLDSEPLWIRVFAEAAARHGNTYGDADRPGTLGQPLTGTARYLADKVGIPAATMEAELAETMREEYLAGPPLVAGAGALVAELMGQVYVLWGRDQLLSGACRNTRMADAIRMTPRPSLRTAAGMAPGSTPPMIAPITDAAAIGKTVSRSAWLSANAP